MKTVILCLAFILLFLPLARAKAVEYTSQGLRDPFRSPFETLRPDDRSELPEDTPLQYGLAHLRVQGLVWGTSMPQAIINNTVVRVGEVIGGAEVLDIRKEGVFVLYEGQQYIVRPIIPKKSR